MYNFIHVPKVAGDAFSDIIEGRRGQIAYAGHIQATSIQTVAFVRNPYDRLVSAYYYLIKSGGQNQLDLSFRDILSAYVSFRDFVLHINEDDLHNRILHIKPMYWFVCDQNNNVIVNRIFKIENVEEIDAFLWELGIDKKLSDYVKNTSSHMHYSLYLDGDIVREINNIYDLDFKLFNYEKII